MADEMPFYAVELEVYLPGGASAMVGLVLGEAPIGQAPPAGGAIADSTILRAADMGYVTPLGDPAGVLIYPPTVTEATAVDRSVDLSIHGAGASVAWGNVRLMAAPEYAEITGDRNVDSRTVRVLRGKKPRDTARKLWTNPLYSTLEEVFVGLAQAWKPDEDGVNIPVRDATYWIERQLQQNVYDGTGGINGTPDLKGRPLPKLRGGVSGNPVCNISPVLIDPVANIWQFNDGPANLDGTTALYEGGKNVHIYQADTTNLWSGTTTAGQFRTDVSKGLFQLGSPVAAQITLDGYGNFPVAGAQTTAVDIALNLLTEDLSVPAGNIDTASFAALDTAFPYEAGWYWDGSSPVDGADAVGFFIASLGARIVPLRNGKLGVAALRAIPGGTTPVGTYTTEHIVSMRRVDLPVGLAPPPYRLRWGYNHNHTLMNTGVDELITEERKAFLREPDRYGLWSSLTVQAAYRRPSDPAPLTTALLDEADATAVATAMGALWGAGRRLYRVQMWMEFGLAHEIGDVLMIVYPLDSMDGGVLGRVVGEQFRGSDDTITLLVLV